MNSKKKMYLDGYIPPEDSEFKDLITQFESFINRNEHMAKFNKENIPEVKKIEDHLNLKT